MTYLVGISGPPRSGKDSVGHMLAAILEDRQGIQAQMLACSTPMREAVYALLGQPYALTHYEQHKDDPQEIFGGQSIRQAMIALSEEHAKPRYGQGFWGKSLLGRVWDPAPKLIIVTDMGFQAEVEVLEERFSPHRCAWAQLQRPGYDFSKDSRSYVGTPDYAVQIDNTSTVEECAERLFEYLVMGFCWDFVDAG